MIIASKPQYSTTSSDDSGDDDYDIDNDREEGHWFHLQPFTQWHEEEDVKACLVVETLGET